MDPCCSVSTVLTDRKAREAGHYPQSRQPPVTIDAVVRFLVAVHANN
jgi:hypothetical protein